MWCLVVAADMEECCKKWPGTMPSPWKDGLPKRGESICTQFKHFYSSHLNVKTLPQEVSPGPGLIQQHRQKVFLLMMLWAPMFPF